jgi:hypothetical protein
MASLDMPERQGRAGSQARVGSARLGPGRAGRPLRSGTRRSRARGLALASLARAACQGRVGKVEQVPSQQLATASKEPMPSLVRQQCRAGSQPAAKPQLARASKEPMPNLLQQQGRAAWPPHNQVLPSLRRVGISQARPGRGRVVRPLSSRTLRRPDPQGSRARPSQGRAVRPLGSRTHRSRAGGASRSRPRRQGSRDGGRRSKGRPTSHGPGSGSPPSPSPPSRNRSPLSRSRSPPRAAGASGSNNPPKEPPLSGRRSRATPAR